MAYTRALKVVYFFAACAFIASFAVMIVLSSDGACESEEHPSCFTDSLASWAPTVLQGVDVLTNSNGDALSGVDVHEGLASIEDCQALCDDGDCGAVVFSPETNPSLCWFTTDWPWQIYKHLDNIAPPELSGATSIIYHAQCNEKEEHSCDENAECDHGKCVCASNGTPYW